jgi:hypothetical protein
MRGSAHLAGLTRDDLADAAAIAAWLQRLAGEVPGPEGDHGVLAFAVTVEWDHVRPGP